MLRKTKRSIFHEPAELKNLDHKIVDDVYFINVDTPTSKFSFHFKDRKPSMCDEDDNGMFGVVLYGYFLLNQVDSAPQLAVKRFRTLCQGDNKEHVIRCMKKEVICQRILGRNSYYFLIGDVGFIFYPWQPGVRIRDFLDAKNQITPLQILSVMASLLKQLQLLHDANVSHGDLSGENVLIDPYTFQGSLVDLGSAQINCQSHMLQKDMNAIVYLMERLIEKLSSEDENELLTDLCQRLRNINVSEAIKLCNDMVNEMSAKREGFKASL